MDTDPTVPSTINSVTCLNYWSNKAAFLELRERLNKKHRGKEKNTYLLS